MHGICTTAGSWEFQNYKTKLHETKFNGVDIEVEEALPTRSVIISNINETKRNQEYLEQYFSDYRKCGAHGFDSVELLENGQVLVHFEDAESKMFHAIVTFKCSRYIYYSCVFRIIAIYG